MSCNPGCYEATIQECGDIKLNAGLVASTDYYAIVSKPNKTRVFQRKLTTDAGGVLTIPENMFPAGYLIAGSFLNIEIRDGSDYLSKKKLVFSTLQYDCVLVELVDFDIDYYDASPINIIQ